MTPYLLLVALLVGLPVSMGSGELRYLELHTNKIREIEIRNIFIGMQSNFKNDSVNFDIFHCAWTKLYHSAQQLKTQFCTKNLFIIHKQLKNKLYHNPSRPWNCK